MVNVWDVDQLDVDLLLAEWRWLCPRRMKLVARNAFGDLFLSDEADAVYQLDIAAGTVNEIAHSVVEFRELSAEIATQKEWFARDDESVAAAHGLLPYASQCIAFRIPLCFAGIDAGNEAYIADLNKHLAFTGDIHRQMAGLPNGTDVRLVVKNLRVNEAGDSVLEVRN